MRYNRPMDTRGDLLKVLGIGAILFAIAVLSMAATVRYADIRLAQPDARSIYN
jgi:hypothetical protein